MKSQDEIITSFGEAYEVDGFPPLAGKIMGLLYVSDKKYFSFDEIVQQVKASKGAVSKILKLLVDLHRVNYIICKDSSRKRLFYLDIKGIRFFVDVVIANYRKQDLLLQECLKHRNSENPELNKFIENSIALNADMLEMLDDKVKKYFNQ